MRNVSKGLSLAILAVFGVMLAAALTGCSSGTSAQGPGVAPTPSAVDALNKAYIAKIMNDPNIPASQKQIEIQHMYAAEHAAPGTPTSTPTGAPATSSTN
jgi:hypothetical protein